MKKLPLALAVMLACSSQAANAEVRINGFASIVGGQSLDKNQELYGYDDEFNFKNESMFALQVSADLQDNLSATAQVVAKGKDNFNAEFEWAYLTYQLSDESQISAGKMRLPFFRYSDFLDVGYAYNWIRPPQSIYDLSFSTYEGISYLHNTTLGEWDSTLQVLYGGFNDKIVALGSERDSKLTNLTGINWSVSRDWFSARAAYLQAKTTISLENSEVSPLLDGLAQFGLNDQVDSLLINGGKGSFMGVGFSIDYNDFLFDTEYAELKVKNSLIAPATDFYASVGYRITPKFLALVTYEQAKDKHSSSRYNQVPTTVDVGGMQVPVSTNPTNPNAPLLRDLTNGALVASQSKATSYTFGIRYDFHPAAAFKASLSRQDDKLTNQKTDVLAVGVDLVF